MQKLNVGLLGYGLAGSVFHAPLIQSCPDMTLAAIGSRSFDGKDIPDGVKTGRFEEVVHDPEIDLIVIATANEAHFPQAFAALKAGKHVVLDKPATIRLSQLDTLVSLAEQMERKLTVFQNRRWDGSMLTAKQVLDNGALGTISYAEFHFDRFAPTVKNRWREDPVPGAGVLYDLGPHMLDQAFHLFGLPQAVTANTAIQRPGARVPDFFHVILDYPDMRAVCHATSLVYDHGPRIALYGNQGGFQHFGLDSQEDDLKAGKRPGDAGWGNMDTARAVMLPVEGGAGTDIASLNGSYESFYTGVARAILSGAPLPVPTESARNSFAILEAAVRSSVEKTTQALI